jgi:hypothetical protein
MIPNSSFRASSLWFVAMVGVFFGVSAHQQAQADTITFITPKLSTPDLTFQVEAIYDPGAHTLESTSRVIALHGGPVLALFAPTATPLTGDAGLALVKPVVFLHKLFTFNAEVVTDNPPFDLGDSRVYDPAFLAANGGTAAGAEAGLIQALVGQQAYLAGFSGQNSGKKLFLSPVPDAGNTVALLGVTLAALFVTAPRLRRQGLSRRVDKPRVKDRRRPALITALNLFPSTDPRADGIPGRAYQRVRGILRGESGTRLRPCSLPG